MYRIKNRRFGPVITERQNGRKKNLGRQAVGRIKTLREKRRKRNFSVNSFLKRRPIRRFFLRIRSKLRFQNAASFEIETTSKAEIL